MQREGIHLGFFSRQWRFLCDKDQLFVCLGSCNTRVVVACAPSPYTLWPKNSQDGANRHREVGLSVEAKNRVASIIQPYIMVV